MLFAFKSVHSSRMLFEVVTLQDKSSGGEPRTIHWIINEFFFSPNNFYPFKLGVFIPLISNSMAASCLPNEFSATHTYRPESAAFTLLMISFDFTDVSVYISSTLYLSKINVCVLLIEMYWNSSHVRNKRAVGGERFKSKSFMPRRVSFIYFFIQCPIYIRSVIRQSDV